MTTHATLFHDRDKTLCGLRLSRREGRREAVRPVDVECDTCALKVLRLQQQDAPNAPLSLFTWPPGTCSTPPREPT